MYTRVLNVVFGVLRMITSTVNVVARKPPADSTLWSARELSGQPTHEASQVGISAFAPSNAQIKTASDSILPVSRVYRRVLRVASCERLSVNHDGALA